MLQRLVAVTVLVALPSVATAAVDSGVSPGSAASAQATYPVDTSPPKDLFNEGLLRTLSREASAAVVCRLLGLVDVFPQQKDPDVFYDATCELTESISRAPKDKSLHFIWQVERGSRLPPLGSELLVYLKKRKLPLDGGPPLRWVALDTGVLRYTPALKARIHRGAKKKN